MQLVDAGMIAFAGWHALKGRVEWPLTFQVPRMLRSTLRDVQPDGAGGGRVTAGGDGGGPDGEGKGSAGTAGRRAGSDGREGPAVGPGDTYVLCWNAERLRKRERWPDYRDRPEIWEEAGEEDFLLMLRVLNALGAVQYRADGWEADEVLAALAHRLEGEVEPGGRAAVRDGGDARVSDAGPRDERPGSEGGGTRARTGDDAQIVIRSDDKDFMQLLSPSVRMEGRRRGTVRHTDVEDELGVPPAYVADLLALAGDRADGIPRIVPPSTARALIRRRGHVRDWIDRDPAEVAGLEADEPVEGAMAAEEVAAALEESRDQLRLNLELVDLSEEAVGPPPDPVLDGWGDLEAAREIGERTGIGWLTDDDLAEEYALLRDWGERTRERLGV